MGNITLVAAGLVVLVVVLLGQGIFWLLRSLQESQAREVQRRLGTLPSNEQANLLRMQGVDTRIRTEAGLDVMLRQAGSPYPMSTLQAAMAVGALIGALIGMVLFKSLLGLIGIAGALVPVLVLRFRANARMRKLTEQLPEALDLISRSLQAGHGLGESLRMAADEIPEPIGPEFDRVYEENNLGRDLRECLQNLLRRNPGCFDLQIFVSSVLLQRDTGGNLVEILQNISATVRARFLFEGKLAALTSEARFTAWVLGSLPFFVSGMIMVRNPDYLMPLVTDPLGNLMLAACIMMFSFGVFLMYDFAKVEV